MDMHYGNYSQTELSSSSFMNSDNNSVIDIHFEVTLVHAYYLAIIMIDGLGLLNTKLMQITHYCLP